MSLAEFGNGTAPGGISGIYHLADYPDSIIIQSDKIAEKITEHGYDTALFSLFFGDSRDVFKIG